MRRSFLWMSLSLFFALGLTHARGPELVSWGPRVGLASGPDQLVGGAHWNLGTIRPRLRFVPTVQAGFGDNHTVIEGTAPVHWVFRDAHDDFTPYAGGGLALAWIDRDLPAQSSGDDSDVELALKATGGLEWHLRNNTDFFIELNFVFGDIHDFQAVAGWSFRRAGKAGSPAP